MTRQVDGMRPSGSARPSRLRELRAVLFGAAAAFVGLSALRSAPGSSLLQLEGVPFLPPTAVAGGSGGGRRADPNRLGHGGGGDRQPNTEHAERRPASKRIIVGFGFWVFLLSDIIMFAAFFAAYGVLAGQTAGGPAGRELFNITGTAVETGCLLVSSLTCGLASVGLQARNGRWFYGAMAVTFVLGTAFIGLEVREFWSMVAKGDGPSHSAFLSAFFALVGLHGMHVSAGLLWLLTVVAQVWAKGYRADILRRVMCFSLFWHALDIVWVGLFTVVYLMGVAA